MIRTKNWTYNTFRKFSFNVTKRYVIYWYKWYWDNINEMNDPSTAYKENEYVQFDTMDEVNAHIEFINEIYADIKRPEINEAYWQDILTKQKYPFKPDIHESRITYHKPETVTHKDYQFFWGYMILDYEKNEIVKMCGDKHPEFNSNYKTDLRLKDILFRRNDEIPENYKWDNGEYDGWLQFRWGNGLNAIEKEDKLNEIKREQEYKEREKRRKEREELEEELKLLNEMNEF